MKTCLFAILIASLIPTASFAKATFNESAFQSAIESGDLAEVKKQISAGAKVNLVFDIDDGPTTPLVVSVRRGHKEMTSFLLKQRANPNGAKDGYIPLIEAAVRSDVETLEQLVKGGAKVNLQNKEGRTALMTAAEYGCVQCVKVLLVAKADPKKNDSTGKRAKDLVGEVAAKNELHRLLGE